MTYFKKGLLIDAAVVVAFFLWCLVSTILIYDGTCSNPGFMGGPSRSCTFFGALSDEIFGLLLISLVSLWWLVIPLLLLPPVIGLLIGLGRSGKAQR